MKEKKPDGETIFQEINIDKTVITIYNISIIIFAFCFDFCNDLVNYSY